MVGPKALLVQDDRSFLEMSIYRIKKYFKNEKNNS